MHIKLWKVTETLISYNPEGNAGERYSVTLLATDEGEIHYYADGVGGTADKALADAYRALTRGEARPQDPQYDHLVDAPAAEEVTAEEEESPDEKPDNGFHTGRHFPRAGKRE